MWGLAPIPISKDPTLLGGPRGFSTVSIFTYQKTESPPPSHLWKQAGKRKRESTPSVCQMERSNTPPPPIQGPEVELGATLPTFHFPRRTQGTAVGTGKGVGLFLVPLIPYRSSTVPLQLHVKALGLTGYSYRLQGICSTQMSIRPHRTPTAITLTPPQPPADVGLLPSSLGSRVPSSPLFLPLVVPPHALPHPHSRPGISHTDPFTPISQSRQKVFTQRPHANILTYDLGQLLPAEWDPR